MKKLDILIITIFLLSNCFAQNKQLRGIITVQNSTYNDGKTKYVDNALVETQKAKPVRSDNVGKFSLGLNIKDNECPQIALAVNLFGNYKDYEVVNTKDIADITACRQDPIKIWICRKGELEERRAASVNLNLKPYNDKIASLQKELNELRSKNVFNERRGEISDSLDILDKISRNIFKSVNQYLDSLLYKNLDEIEEHFQKAYSCIERGFLDSVDYYLPDEWLDNKIQTGKQLKSTGSKMIDAGNKELQEAIEGYLAKARTADIQNNYTEAEKYYQKVINVDSLNLKNLLEYADFLNKTHEYSKTIELYQYYLPKYQQLIKDESDKYCSDFAIILNNLGCVYSICKDWDMADSLLFWSKGIREFQVKNDTAFLPALADVLNNIGSNYNLQRKFSNAQTFHLQSLQIRENLAKQNTKYLADLQSVLFNLGNNCSDKKDYLQSEKYFLRCIEINEQLAKENPKIYLPKLASSLENYANSLFKQSNQSKTQTSFDHYLRCLEIRQKLAKDNEKSYLPDLANILLNIGNIYCSERDFFNAEAYYKESLKINKQLAENNPKLYLRNIASVQMNLGALYNDQELYTQAIEYYTESLKIVEHLTKDNPEVYLPDLMNILYNIGEPYFWQEKYDTAMLYWTHSLDITNQLAKNDTLGVYYPELSDVLTQIASCYFMEKDYLKAEEYYLKAILLFNNLSIDNQKNFSSNLFKTICLLIDTYRELSKYQSAIKYGHIAIDLINKYKDYDVFKNNLDNTPNVKLELMYQNVAWDYLLFKQYKKSEQYALITLEFNSNNDFAKTILAHTMLFQNHLLEAEKLYIELAKNEDNRQQILSDFEEFEKENIIPSRRKKDVEKLKRCWQNDE